MTTDKYIDKIDMFQDIYWKEDEFGWWGFEQIQTDIDTQFASKEFQEDIYVREVQLTLAAPYHQEIFEIFEVTWRTLRTIAHLII